MAQHPTGAEMRQERHSRMWAPVIAIGVLAAFGLQPLLPFLDPVWLLIAVMSWAMMYASGHAYTVDQKRGWLVNTAFVVGAVLAVVSAAVCLLTFFAIIHEIRAPCAALRANLIAHPDSSDADIYQALHCPVAAPGILSS